MSCFVSARSVFVLDGIGSDDRVCTFGRFDSCKSACACSKPFLYLSRVLWCHTEPKLGKNEELSAVLRSRLAPRRVRPLHHFLHRRSTTSFRKSSSEGPILLRGAVLNPVSVAWLLEAELDCSHGGTWSGVLMDTSPSFSSNLGPRRATRVSPGAARLVVSLGIERFWIGGAEAACVEG